ncbi:DUF302 domain-containing protein [Litoribrevibacter euphylliae]|uniref:DUF302 domain-containing protein n=1 Tax=Litoribrevibacter euphylliae TaxID=1834034 RepID=A0ABV7HBA7_9GAMM
MIKHIAIVIISSLLSTMAIASDSLISLKSAHSVTETANRFESLLKEKGLTVFTRINHQENAENINQKLAPTQVIIFGNPKVGTPLMQCSKTVAIDLPQKALIWQDQQQQVWLSFNNPDYLKARHNIQGCEKVLTKIFGVLTKLGQAATK